ncbi:hypothetical protein [Pontibacter actiniarum]|uniref:Uncharacterized protein n=1 Tax=Pontibacter actiniarum TaxID=323450 RepID=A0A1X9YTU0_9BACT|nr:hypothetical protein [Pontibacter actiniarum]ARS36241.1 hypothetical protein CA264_12795 [Pontibacter actiniarum]
MKIIVLMAASMFGFGYAVQETYQVPQPKEVIVVRHAPAALEEPVMDVMLDTVEITVEAPVAVAAL